MYRVKTLISLKLINGPNKLVFLDTKLERLEKDKHKLIGLICMLKNKVM